eukprot:203384-Prymnesium_polylepis.1
MRRSPATPERWALSRNVGALKYYSGAWCTLESRPRSESRGGAGERMSARPAHASPHTSRNGHATRDDKTDVTERIGFRS